MPVLMQSDEAIDAELNITDPDPNPRTRGPAHSKKIYFAVVGPFVKESTKGTG